MTHVLAAVHRVVMDHMAFVPSQYDIAAQAKRLNAVARCLFCLPLWFPSENSLATMMPLMDLWLLRFHRGSLELGGSVV